MKKYFYIIAILALGLTACNKNEIQTPADEPVAGAPVYHFSIPASIGDDADIKALTIGESTIISTFDDQNDYIYVHNVTRDAWALAKPDPNYPYVDWSYLQPSEISADGKSCTLTGDLSFLTYNSETSSWEECTTVADGDTYDLYYQAKTYYDGSLYLSYLLNANWQSPNGLIDNIPDFDYAIAKNVTLSLSGNTLTMDGTASFVNYGSIFRQRLTFVPGANPGEGSTEPANITNITISTEHNTMLVQDMILNEDANKIGKTLRTRIDLSLDPWSDLTSVIDANKDIYFALAFDNTTLQDGDKLTFKAIDDNYNIYTGSKTIPAGGLQNGKYYYGDVTLTYQYNGFPTITRGDGGVVPVAADQGAAPFEYIDINAYWDGDSNHDPVPIDMTISGNSEGFCFRFNNGGTVTLTGNGTAYSRSTYYPFISNDSYKEALTIILDSDYAISSPNYYYAIGPNSFTNNITIKTTGGTHTLTLTTCGDDNGAYYKGIWNFNYDYGNISAGDVIPELAADANTTVTLTSASMNVDGNWVFVYTVTTTNP